MGEFFYTSILKSVLSRLISLL
uniref:Uncharacterized protein n=1 Tax=Heterorhabditis bacteriophora TaxID=37862 RepID=A0A1I7WVV1_HETBA